MVIKLNSDILAKTFELKEMLVNSDTYMQLKECEKNMLDDKECFTLLNAYQLAQGKYNDAKRFEKYGGKVEEAQKELSELKLKVDENQLVKAYNNDARLPISPCSISTMLILSFSLSTNKLFEFKWSKL